jgi:GGDEF domain-containing protein
MSAVLGNPRLRSVDTATLTPAERLQELATSAQVQGRFAQLQEICSRLGVPVSAVVIRLEGLDRLRDEVGFGAPLAAIVCGADAITTQMRPGDEFGRWSDDELAVLCPGASAEEVIQLANQLVAVVEQVRVRHSLQHDVEITLPLRPTARIVTDLATADAGFERHLHVA